jgi:hypothetical protein
MVPVSSFPQGSGGITVGDQNHLEIGEKVIGVYKEDDG